MKRDGACEDVALPACGACPEVEVLGDEVRIGEAGNLVVLKRGEWNVLVDLVVLDTINWESRRPI